MSRVWTIGGCHSALDTDSPYLAGLDFREIPLSLIEDGAISLAALTPPAVLSMGVFPSHTMLFGGRANLAAALDRADRVVRMVSDAGLAGITFGAGAVRSIPAAISREEGLAILATILARLDDGCQAAGLTFFLENLPPTQSNVFNTIDEIAAFCDRFGMSTIKILFDLRAAALSCDDPGAFDRHQSRIGHVHLTFPEDVLLGDHTTDAFLDRVARSTYAGRIAIETIGVRWSAETMALWRRAQYLLERSNPITEAAT